MARRVGLALALVLAGLAVLAFAELPPGLPGPFWRPYTHVPVDAWVLDIAEMRYQGKGTGVSALRYHYVFDGHPHDATFRGSDSIRLPSTERRVGDVQVGERLRAWVDPDHPASASLHREGRLGHDGEQIVLGLALIAAGVVVVARRR